MKKKVLVPIVTAGVCVGVLLTAGTSPAIGTTGPTITPVMGGMNSPRGIAFDGQGSMYVSESGAAGAGEAGLTRTGKVSKFAWGSRLRRGPGRSRPSTRRSPAPPTPTCSGLRASARWATVPQARRATAVGAIGARRCQVTMIMSESTPGIRNESGGALTDPQAGRLFRLDAATGADPQDRQRRLRHVRPGPATTWISSPTTSPTPTPTRYSSPGARGRCPPHVRGGRRGEHHLRDRRATAARGSSPTSPTRPAPRSATRRRRASPKARTASCMWEH